MSHPTILSGIVGSTAYGLAREGSDIDRLGIFAAPTYEIAGLRWHPSKESRVGKNPDYAQHEVGKACRLLLKCNPTVTELLWLPYEGYEVITGSGTDLRGIRYCFLSEKAVRDAYGGYAHAQATRLENRGDGTFSSDTRNRTVKHGRHLLRLLRQGRQLLETGALTVKVDRPEDYWAFDDMTPAQMIEVYRREKALFDAAQCVLPERPDFDTVEQVLERIRRAHS